MQVFFADDICLFPDLSSLQRPQSKNRPAKQRGLYVPKGIVEKVGSENNARKALADDKWLRSLIKAYPNMPLTDRAEIYQRCHSRALQSNKVHRDIAICRYVQDRYTAFGSLSSAELNAETSAGARQATNKILSIWKGTG